MGDALRRYYLQTLGIASYEPRFVLPNAQPSVAVAPEVSTVSVEKSVSPIEPATENLSAVNDAPVAVERNQKQIASTLSDIQNNLVTPSSVSTSSPVAIDQSRQSAKPKTIQFSLSLWRASPRCVVLDTRQIKLALPTEQLLKNILFALDCKQAINQPEILKWPVMQGVVSNDQRSEARGYVQAVLEKQFEHAPFEILLLMGATAGEFALGDQYWPEDAVAGELLGKPFLLPNYKAVVLPSLTAMLQKPQLKAVAWRALQPFVGQL